MKTYRLFFLVLALAPILVGMLAGCQIRSYNASEVVQTVSVPPFFKDRIEARGIKRVTREDGTVVRQAADLKHELSILSFVREVNYKDAELTTAPEEKAEPK